VQRPIEHKKKAPGCPGPFSSVGRKLQKFTVASFEQVGEVNAPVGPTGFPAWKRKATLLTLPEIWRFYFPLALTSMIAMAMGPLVTFGLARGLSSGGAARRPPDTPGAGGRTRVAGSGVTVRSSEP
jgi:hypothetical protein